MGIAIMTMTMVRTLEHASALATITQRIIGPRMRSVLLMPIPGFMIAIGRTIHGGVERLMWFILTVDFTRRTIITGRLRTGMDMGIPMVEAWSIMVRVTLVQLAARAGGE